MNITCRYSKAIDFADPAYIIGADVTVGTVAGTPVALIRPEALLARKDDVRDGIQDMLQHAASNARRHELNLWQRATMQKPRSLESQFKLMNIVTPQAVDSLHTSARQTRESRGYAMPRAHTFIDKISGDATRNACSFVVLAPESFLMDDILPFEKTSFSSSLSIHGDAFRYIVNCHEIAHAAGADEAQADYIATLMCRRTFGDNPAPAIMADARAVIIATDGARSEPKARAESKYGVYDWNMVEAIDEACAIPLSTVKAMDDAQIFAHAHHRRPDAVARTSILSHAYGMASFALADERNRTDLALKKSRLAAHYGGAAAIPPDMHAVLGEMEILNTLAAKLKLVEGRTNVEEMKEAATLAACAMNGGDIRPECEPMAWRLAKATERLSRGAEAYQPKRLSL